MNEVVFKKRFNVKKDLFSDNEQGLWLDPSDMTAGKAGWRRNLLSYTEQFDNSYWTKQQSICVANSANSPFGDQTADLVYPSGDTSFQGLARTAGATFQRLPHRFSIYAKASGKNWLYFFNINFVGGNGGVWFDLQAGTVGAVTGAWSNATIESVGNGWYRCSATATPGGTNDYIYFLAGDNNNSANCTPNATDGLLLYGAQLELGSTPTEYQRITDFSTEFKQAFPTHTLYQDSNGVTPCTAAGDPVGLILDQSRGGLGAKTQYTLTNGSFDSALTGWNASNATADTSTSGQVSVTSTSGAAYGFIQATGANVITTAASAWYEIVVDCELVSGTGFFGAYTTSGVYSLFTDTGRKTRKIIVQGANVEVRVGVTNSIGTSIIVYDIKVYQVPGNHAYQTTSGQRPTLARIPSSGRRNLLSYSEQLDNAAWTKRGTATITANDITAPDGTATAEQLSGLNTSNNDVFNTNYSSVVIAAAGTNYTPSFWVKRISTSGVFFISNPTSAVDGQWNIDLSQLPDAWTRITATTPGVTVVNAFVTSAGGFGGVLLRAVSGGPLSMHVWGFQSELGSTATNYQKVVATTDVTESGVGDLWHLVFDGSDDSLVTNSVDFATWTQETRRNLLFTTESFSGAGWDRQDTTIVDNVALAPNGTTTAATMTASASGTFKGLVASGFANGTYTISCYLKANGKTFAFFYNVGATGGATGVWFNLSSGSVGTVGAAWSNATITDAGNGWYRCSAAITYAGPTNYMYILSSDGDASTVHTLNASDGILVWGAQRELGTLTTYQRVGTDEMTVIAGVRKNDDAYTPAIVEQSVAFSANAGSISIGKGENNSTNWYIQLRGSSTTNGYSPRTYAAPITNVVTALADISQSDKSLELITRVDGVAGGYTLGAESGTGNFGNYPFYIGRRGGSSFPYNGHLYQLIVRGRTTPTGKLLEAERFVGKKTGVNL